MINPRKINLTRRRPLIHLSQRSVRVIYGAKLEPEHRSSGCDGARGFDREVDAVASCLIAAVAAVEHSVAHELPRHAAAAVGAAERPALALQLTSATNDTDEQDEKGYRSDREHFRVVTDAT